MSLNSLALTLVDIDPGRARALLEESIERIDTPSEASPSGVLTACLTAGRLADWDLTVALVARSMHLERWVPVPMQVAPCLALCARALAEGWPEQAGVLHGAAYAIFRRAAVEAGSSRQSGTVPVGSNANFVLAALRGPLALQFALIGTNAYRAFRD